MLVEKNVYGYVVIRGILGQRVYIGYSRKDAIKMYEKEIKENA